MSLSVERLGHVVSKIQHGLCSHGTYGPTGEPSQGGWCRVMISMRSNYKPRRAPSRRRIWSWNGTLLWNWNSREVLLEHMGTKRKNWHQLSEECAQGYRANAPNRMSMSQDPVVEGGWAKSRNSKNIHVARTQTVRKKVLWDNYGEADWDRKC